VTDELVVWLRGLPVADIRRKRQRTHLTYRPEFVNDALGKLLLSCSLPVQRRAIDATNFFDGVLPEGQFRAALSARAGVVASDTFGLLERYGRDIAGAMTVTTAGRPEDLGHGSVLPLNRQELENEVSSLPDRPLGVHDDSELSIAGMQNKLLLVRMNDGGWGRPVGGAPSTHIVKLDSQSHPGVVAAEADAMLLARHVGLTSVEVQLDVLGGIPCIIVERFDRTVLAGQTTRTHQEDACQALGLSPLRKYELRGRGALPSGGGPEFEQIAGLLDLYAHDQVAELEVLAKIATFTALIGNADAHGKNIAFIHDAEGHVRLAPLYDTVPTVLFPRLKNEAAMTIGGLVDLAAVDLAAIGREARRWHLGAGRAERAATETAEQLLAGLEQGLIDTNGPVAELVRHRCERFLSA
jgi:serine/threonine-protein kinase HipA